MRKRRQATKFEKGRSKTGGRKLGSPNRQPPADDLVQGIYLAMQKKGGREAVVEFFVHMIRRAPRQFIRILARTVPYEKEA